MPSFSEQNKAMTNLDKPFLTKYLEGEIGRLKKVEENAKESLASAEGDVAKFNHLISLETLKDEEHQHNKRVAEKKRDHFRIVLESISPKLDKLVEQHLILSHD